MHSQCGFINAYTVELVLKDSAIGHKNVVYQAMQDSGLW